jgi:hypothetical protein
MLNAEHTGPPSLSCEFAGVLKNDFAVAVVMVIEHDARMRGANEPRQLELAVLNRSAA